MLLFSKKDLCCQLLVFSACKVAFGYLKIVVIITAPSACFLLLDALLALTFHI